MQIRKSIPEWTHPFEICRFYLTLWYINFFFLITAEERKLVPSSTYDCQLRVTWLTMIFMKTGVGVNRANRILSQYKYYHYYYYHPFRGLKACSFDCSTTQKVEFVFPTFLTWLHMETWHLENNTKPQYNPLIFICLRSIILILCFKSINHARKAFTVSRSGRKQHWTQLVSLRVKHTHQVSAGCWLLVKSLDTALTWQAYVLTWIVWIHACLR